MLENDNIGEKGEKQDKVQNIYLSIDHLKSGNYVFNIMLNNKVVKSFRLKK